MGQSFREQLAQNIALAQRVVTKISGREEHLLTLTFCPFFFFYFHHHRLQPASAFVPIGDYAESHGDKTDHELLALR